MGQNKAGSSLPEQEVIDLPSKDTEKSITIPKDATKITIQESNANDIRYSFTQGKVAGSNEPHWKLKSGQARNIEDLYLQGKNADNGRTLYVASPVAGSRVQIEIWK